MSGIGPGLGAALFAGLAMVVPIASAQALAGALEGRWGGERLQLVLDASGGRIEMDCASGTIAGAIKPGANGAFTAAGTFEQHGPGPQRADGTAAAAKARYSGEVKDGAMTLSILPDGAGAPQTFQLRKGAAVKLVKCL